MSNRTLRSLALAVCGAALWLLWTYEHEHTSIRAPWTGLTYAAAALAFVAAGIAGRGWRAVAVAAVAAAAAVVLVDPLVWRDEDTEPVPGQSCDPGCISPEVAVVMAGAEAAVLATVGIALRRTIGRRLGVETSPRARG
jgi:hypothetical protein